MKRTVFHLYTSSDEDLNHKYKSFMLLCTFVGLKQQYSLPGSDSLN